MPSPGTSALLKTILIPPLAALGIYVLLTYLILPYYRKYRERSSYSLLPSSINDAVAPAANTATSLVARLVQKLSSVMLRAAGNVTAGQTLIFRRGSSGSLGFGVGDEELTEGIVGLGDEDLGRRGRTGLFGENEVGGQLPGVDSDGERRLSRELESGFMSDSD